MKSLIEKLTEGKVLLSDGAWGTYLQEKGLIAGDCPELWNLNHYDDVLQIAKSYIDAGSDIIQTNSFGGSKIKLSNYGLEENCYEINKSAGEISREAAGYDKFVIGSMGPTGKFLMMAEVSEEELYDSYAIQAKGLEDGGVDACCIETFYDIDEAIIAVNAVNDKTNLEIILTFTFEKKLEGMFNTIMGITPEQYVNLIDLEKVDVIGSNCGNGFLDMIDVVTKIKNSSKDKYIIVHANAGIPEIKENKILYPDTPDRMSDFATPLIKAGADIIGGCCGTTPAHIRALREIVDEINRNRN
ncbi:homocysteine S-methyltransferase family protein [Bacteroidota bacterium]